MESQERTCGGSLVMRLKLEPPHVGSCNSPERNCHRLLTNGFRSRSSFSQFSLKKTCVELRGIRICAEPIFMNKTFQDGSEWSPVLRFVPVSGSSDREQAL